MKRSKLYFCFRCMCTKTYVILYTKFGDLFDKSCSTKVHQHESFFSLLNLSFYYRKSHSLLDALQFLNKACGKRATLIEWKKRRRVMTKLNKSSIPVFLKQLGIWFAASSASSSGTSFFPRFLIEASAKREWLVRKRKGPVESYFIRWHMAYNKRRRIFEQESGAKCVAACVWLWKQTKGSLKLWKY